jgi:hypothetical protein
VQNKEFLSIIFIHTEESEMSKSYNHLFKAAAIATLFAAAPSVFAQRYIPSVSVPAAGSTPGKYRHCEQAYAIGYDVTTFKTCEDAIEEARKIAERFAGTNGKLHGYLEGFSYAIYKAAEANENDPVEVKRGEDALLATMDSDHMELPSGSEHGQDEGQLDGAADGKSDALSVWQVAFQTGQLPQGNSVDNYSMDVPEYRATESDPYGKYVGRKTVQSIMRNDISPELRELVVQIQESDRIFLLSQRYSYNIWDLWFDSGRYEVNRYKNGAWVNANESLDFWHENVKKIENAYNRYDHLATNHEVRIVNEDNTVSTKIVNLKKEFDDSFLASYGYYMHHNWRLKFHEFLPFGATAGETTGVQVGKRIAFENGYATEYNKQYHISAARVYQDAYVLGHDGKDGYEGTFDRVFNDYKNNAKLAIAKIEKIGKIDDDIFSRGEEVKFRITIENHGGVSAGNLRLNVTGNVRSSANVKLGSLTALDANTFETDYIAQINQGQDINQDVHLVLSVTSDNNGSISRDTSIDVRNQIEATGRAAVANVNAVSGSATVTLPIKNVTSIDATNLSADLIVGNENVKNLKIGTLAGKESKSCSYSCDKLKSLKPYRWS